MTSMRMKPLDSVWLMMESADTPMHVGVLAIFRKPARAPADYMRSCAQQMREHKNPVAPWNLRLAERRVTSVAPRLVEDRDFDLDYHFRHSALPEPGGERELGVVVSRMHSQALDRSRPLWEFHLIEGLENDRFAFYFKVHHALVDNVNGLPLLLDSLSASVRSLHCKPLWTMPVTEDATEQEEVDSGELLSAFSNPAESVASVGKAVSGFLRDVFKQGEQRSFLMPFGTPRSTLNRHINYQRRFATQQFEQERIEALAEATDSTVNEILAYLCGSSLRRFFKEYNALPEESLIGALPVSLSERSDRLSGNAIAGLRVALGTHIGDPLARLEAIKTSMKKVREDRASLPEDAATSYVMLRATPTYASQMPGVGRFVPPLFNLSISNTPGPEKARYFNGARLEAVYPVSPLMQFSALSIDCVSYAGTLNIGFTGARDTLPHLQRLAVYLGKAVGDLEKMLQKMEA